MTEQTQPTDALLPCPFCGAAAHFEMDEGRWEWVNCEGCGMQGNRSASLMDDCKSKLAEEWNRRTPPAVAPWRSAVLDLIDDCPGLTLEQDHWLSRRVKELEFASAPRPTAQAAPAADPAYSEACSLATALFEKHYRQEPDYASGRVVWSLCDTTAGVISQIDNMVSGLARAPAAGAVAGPVETIKFSDGSTADPVEKARRYLNAMADHRINSQYFFDDGWPKKESAIDAMATLAVLEQLAAAPTPAAQADSVLEDAARWRELREQHESDEDICCVFAPNDMRECMIPVGSLPGELDAFMDSERAARKQGCAA